MALWVGRNDKEIVAMGVPTACSARGRLGRGVPKRFSRSQSRQDHGDKRSVKEYSGENAMVDVYARRRGRWRASLPRHGSADAGIGAVLGLRDGPQ